MKQTFLAQVIHLKRWSKHLEQRQKQQVRRYQCKTFVAATSPIGKQIANYRQINRRPLAIPGQTGKSRLSNWRVRPSEFTFPRVQSKDRSPPLRSPRRKFQELAAATAAGLRPAAGQKSAQSDLGKGSERAAGRQTQIRYASRAERPTGAALKGFSSRWRPPLEGSPGKMKRTRACAECLPSISSSGFAPLMMARLVLRSTPSSFFSALFLLFSTRFWKKALLLMIYGLSRRPLAWTRCECLWGKGYRRKRL